jgi:hypothetical protein
VLPWDRSATVYPIEDNIRDAYVPPKPAPRQAMIYRKMSLFFR